MTARNKATAIDVELVRNSLPAIAREMSHVIHRTSFNMMLYEVGDYSCALLDSRGQLLSQNEGGVSHFVADIGTVIKDALERNIPMADGDVFVSNHPRYCGQHLNNVCVFTPIYFEGNLSAFSVVRAHWVDIGGMSTGFGGGNAVKDPWMEGLQLDHVKVRTAEGDCEETLRIISDNIRYPQASMGDLASQVAACKLGERRLVRLYENLGTQVFEDAVERIIKQTEARCRAVVEGIPDGVYEAESEFNDRPWDNSGNLKVAVKVTVSGSDITIDLSGCSGQRQSPVNGRTFAGAYIAYKALTAPVEPVNEGSFAGLNVVLPEGTFMMAHYPAPMGSWSLALPTVVDTIVLALSAAVPDLCPAGHKGALGDHLVFFGEGDGKRFIAQSIEGGGWGGSSSKDGESATVTVCQGDVRNGPIEALEMKYPLRVLRRSLRADSGGAGEHRGGLGLEVEAVSLVPGTWALAQSGRRGMPPWGINGGGFGADSDKLMQVPDAAEPVQVDGRMSSPAGATVVVRSAGGGGWGPPWRRPAEAVLEDVREELVSEEAASREYGVAVVRGSDGDLAVDSAKTDELRRKMAS